MCRMHVAISTVLLFVIWYRDKIQIRFAWFIFNGTYLYSTTNTHCVFIRVYIKVEKKFSSILDTGVFPPVLSARYAGTKSISK